MHGGRIDAFSEGPGKGSEFVVRLPLLASAQDPPRQEGQQQKEQSPHSRILVVDDNKDAATSLATLLALMGNEVRTSYDGLAGSEEAAAFRPDLILLDIGMPKMNGYDACRRIREQAWAKNAVIVALTGWGQEEYKRRSQEAGFDNHIVKPIEPAVLEKLLAGVMSRRRGNLPSPSQANRE
jgi:DNA-binding response OmpR family regulator